MHLLASDLDGRWTEQKKINPLLAIIFNVKQIKSKDPNVTKLCHMLIISIQFLWC